MLGTGESGSRLGEEESGSRLGEEERGAGKSDAERVQGGLALKRAWDEENRFDEMLRRHVVRWMRSTADQVLDRIRLSKRAGEALPKRSPKGCLRLRSRSPGGGYDFRVRS